MQLDEALVLLQAAVDQALSRPGCMAVVSPHALGVVLAEHEKQQQEQQSDEP